MYKPEVEKYYSADLIESYHNKTNECYNQALEEKVQSSEKWSKIVEHFKAKGYARDISNASHLHTNTLIIGNFGITEGIILNISFLPKYISFYFYHQNEKPKIPIIDKYGVENQELSFFPFNKKQEKYCINVLDFVFNFFPNFALFNNIFANEKISNVIIDGRRTQESTFFQVIFEDNMYSIF